MFPPKHIRQQHLAVFKMFLFVFSLYLGWKSDYCVLLQFSSNQHNDYCNDYDDYFMQNTVQQFLKLKSYLDFTCSPQTNPNLPL